MSSHALAVVQAALMWAASALVLAVAVLAFVVSFEAISDFAVQVGAFPPACATARRCWSTPSPPPPPWSSYGSRSPASRSPPPGTPGTPGR